jgi:hypothetical protein
MSTLAVNAVTDANGGNTATINSMTPTADSLQGFRNRIINGDMRIDQRNAGAAITSSGFPVDRFGTAISTDGAFSAQQDSSAPAGFSNSVKCTTTTADASLSASQYWFFRQRIEGFNVADLGFGTANAKTVTLSFWVRSSLTGTFSGAMMNGDTNRSYPFNYTISVADTWEQKSVTIPGDTTGTWLKNNGNGMVVAWSLGVGSNYQGTANTWAGAEYYGTSAGTSVIGTLNATWYVTGVQLEVGSVATPFERRPYGTELALCQRYYHKSYPQGTAPADSATGSAYGIGSATVGDAVSVFSPSIPYPVCMRATPTFTFYRTPNSATSGQGAAYNGSWQTGTTTALNAVSDNRFSVYLNKAATFTAGSSYLLEYAYSASAEL